MNKKELYEVCQYIRTHLPAKTKFETINRAFLAVMNCSACTKADLLNSDDVWLIPQEERDEFSGIKGRGWAQSFSQDEIKLIEESVDYSMTHIKEIESLNAFDSKEKLNRIKQDLLNYIDDYNENIKKI